MRAPKASTLLLAPVVSAALAAILAACGGDAPTSPSAASVDVKSSLTATGLAATRCTLPFRGVLNAMESDELLFPTLHVHLVGDGTASHVGRYTMTLETTVTLPQATSEGGILRLTAANGDVVTASVAGYATVTGDIADIVEVATITGGTGRFGGATGSFTITRALAQSTGVSSGSFDGTICLDK